MDLLSKTYYCSAHNSVDIAFFRTFVSLSWIYFPSHSHFFFTLFCGLCFFLNIFWDFCHYWEIFGLCPFLFLDIYFKGLLLLFCTRLCGLCFFLNIFWDFVIIGWCFWTLFFFHGFIFSRLCHFFFV